MSTPVAAVGRLFDCKELQITARFENSRTGLYSKNKYRFRAELSAPYFWADLHFIDGSQFKWDFDRREGVNMPYDDFVKIMASSSDSFDEPEMKAFEKLRENIFSEDGYDLEPGRFGVVRNFQGKLKIIFTGHSEARYNQIGVLYRYKKCLSLR